MSAAQRTYGTRSKIRPGVDLTTITITLHPDGRPPVVKLVGRVLSSDPKVRNSSEVTIDTSYLPPSGQQFISEMKAAYDDQTSS